MTLSIEVIGELEVALKKQASKQGISADRVARRVLADALTPDLKRPADTTLELLILKLGTIGSLHRRDIYDDVHWTLYLT